MLSNPDIQPGAAMNRWIVRIKPFDFELIHVLGTLHTRPEGLSCCAPSPNDPIVDDDTDDWVDRTMGFAVVLMNTTTLWTSWLGLPHQLDHQVSHLGQFTAWDLICSAYHQAGDECDLPAVNIPHSQEAQCAEEWLKLIQAVWTPWPLLNSLKQSYES